ncbi:MAG: quinoprotein relay system zinc metallohydrolase 1 [Hyphomicrobium sp.]
MLTRRQTLQLVPALASLSALAAAIEAAAAPLRYALVPEKLADGIWVVRGAQEIISPANGGAIANVSILDTTAGAVIIDTGPSHRYGDALAALGQQLTGKPVARVYNTHFHPDHVMGNQGFTAATIAAPQGVVDGLKELGNAFADAMYRTAGDWMRGTEVVLPGTILTASVEDFGNRRIRPLAMRGHTGSDLVLFDELSGFMFTGDLVFLDRAPTTPHADIERWRISLANLGGIPFSKLVPGHGPAEDSVRGIEQTRSWLEAVEQIIRDAFEKGLDVTDAIALPLPQWSEKIALARYEYERTVMHLYPKLEALRWPRVDVER